jgi:formylglycine-generating enzyme required for sulfatase activity
VFVISRKLLGMMNLRTFCTMGLSAVTAAFSLAGIARAEAPAPPTGASSAAASIAGEMKTFDQKIPGTEMSFQMVAIPAGTFKMGSPPTEKGRKADEGPQIDVKMDPFYMQSVPVTWDAYNQFLSNYQRLTTAGAPHVTKDQYADAVTYPTPMYEMEAGPALQRMGRTAKFPAVIMSQYAARQYTKWLSFKTGRFYRLPTEAEWEYACRAGTTTAYSFGDDPKKLGEYAWFIDNSALKDGDTGYHPVATKKPNPWGLYDMHGNVANWCLDQYNKDWYKQFAGKQVTWQQVINWPTAQYPRVIRGGNYDAEAAECRSAARHSSTKELNKTDPQLPKSPHWMSDGFWLGFRLVSPAKEPSEAEKNRFWDADDDITRKTLERDREIREIVRTAGAAKK